MSLPDRVDESAALHARVRAVIAAFARGEPASPEPFDAIATDLARFQARHVPGYARLCASRGVDPRGLARAADAPAVPTDAFRLASVFAFDLAAARVVFRTSGTTAAARGAHAMRDPGTYDAAALASGRAILAAGLALPVDVLVLGPDPREAPDSSLAHMNALFVRAWSGAPDPAVTHFVRDGRLEVEALRARVGGLRADRPALVLATSFALVHLLDALGSGTLPLPPGSRVMQTGGYKGRSREVAPAELRLAVAAAFGIGQGSVVGEYGMTELSSQLWQPPGPDPATAYVEPPWARVVPVDPETLSPVLAGEVGLARIEDLANVDSAFAVLTQDRVRRVPGGVELLGRAAGAPPRGCSIALDEMLGGA